MAKKIDFDSHLSDLRKSFKSNKDIVVKNIPSIVEFVEDDKFLGMNGVQYDIDDDGTIVEALEPDLKIGLYPMQKVILKVFYRGSPGNKDLSLTDREIKLLNNLGLDTDQFDKGNLLDKWKDNQEFLELVLALGRRSGKNHLASIMAAYETCRLLERTAPDPYQFYGLAQNDPIAILTIANSGDQATTAYNAIKSRLLNCPYFRDKILPEGIESQIIWVLTEKDKKDNEEAKKRGIPTTKGSIAVKVGHSNSDSLRGLQIFFCIFDEVAFYKNTGGSSSGEQMLNALSPSIQTFKRAVVQKDDSNQIIYDSRGRPKKDIVFDGKTVMISSPAGKVGVFWRYFNNADRVKHRLACRLATWEANPTFTRSILRRQNPDKPEEQFNMEYGAEFIGTAGMKYVDTESLEKVFVDIPDRYSGQPGRVYYIHLDPAQNSNNYALGVCHQEFVFNHDTKEDEMFVVFDLIKIWEPQGGQLIDPNLIDNYVLDLRKSFHIGMLTYDSMLSAHSRKKFQDRGIPNKELKYTNHNKVRIYGELLKLIVQGRVKIPRKSQDPSNKAYNLAFIELDNLIKKFSGNSVKYLVNPDSDVKTDDCADVIAGCIYQCINDEDDGLASPQLANTAGMGTMNQQVWRGMQGVIGVGSGSQVVQSYTDKFKGDPSIFFK